MNLILFCLMTCLSRDGDLMILVERVEVDEQVIVIVRDWGFVFGVLRVRDGRKLDWREVEIGLGMNVD